jgi:hypothetical protein
MVDIFEKPIDIFEKPIDIFEKPIDIFEKPIDIFVKWSIYSKNRSIYSKNDGLNRLVQPLHHHDATNCDGKGAKWSMSANFEEKMKGCTPDRNLWLKIQHRFRFKDLSS